MLESSVPDCMSCVMDDIVAPFGAGCAILWRRRYPQAANAKQKVETKGRKGRRKQQHQTRNKTHNKRAERGEEKGEKSKINPSACCRSQSPVGSAGRGCEDLLR
jgi:hypothetical protein